MDQDQTLHAGRPPPWPHCVRWGPSPLPQRGTAHTQIKHSAYICCGQMAGWIKTPLGREVGLGLCDIKLFDGNPAPLPKKGESPTIFGPCLLWPNGWMDQDATWYGGRPRPRRHCARWGPSSPKKGHSPHFSTMSIVANSWMDQLKGRYIPLNWCGLRR